MTSPRLTRRSLFTGAGFAAGALGLSACGLDGSTAFGSGSATGTITVGSADFTESQIIAEIYAAALRARGLDATTSPAIGAREAYLGALREGTVSVVPDYSGNLLLYFDAETAAVTAQEIVQALPAALPEELGVLAASSAETRTP